MTFVSTALAMAAVLFGAGAPLAILLLPRRWRVHWPVIAPLAGVALVSLVAWLLVWAAVPVSPGVAQTSLLVPLALAAVAVWRERRRTRWLVLGGFLRHALVLGLAIAAMLMIALPLMEARLGLTTVSLGSCDAPDYAAGATLIRDFERSDRSGFNGQSETVALRSADTFFGHWLRLNHFAPAALLAWFSSLFDLPMFKLVTAFGVALHAMALPAVFWIARAGLRLGAVGGLAVAACWACSAPAVYGVAQVALGQIMVVPAVILLTWAGLRAHAEGETWRGALRWAPLAAAAFVVLIAAYTFALVFVLAPLAAGLLWLAVSGRSWARLARAAAVGAIAFAVVAPVFWERMAGLVDRFALFEAIDFGWFIPAFTPERWVGWFGDARLGAGAGFAGWCAVALVAVAWGGFCVRRGRGEAGRIGLASAWLATVAVGYAILAIKGLREGSNELYNAYKVFALLQPLALAALALPLRQLRFASRPGRIAAAVLATGLVVVHWVGAGPMRMALRHPVLWVDKPLAAIAIVAQRDEVGSVNMLLEPMWARLWANSMLLSRHQFFRTETYEGRRPTRLDGTWDLRDGLLGVRLGSRDTIELAGGYHLVRRTGASFCELDLGPGWHAPEGGGAGWWAWNSGEGVLRFSNPHGRELRATLTFGLQGNGARTAEVWQDGCSGPLWRGAATPVTIEVEVAGLRLRPGETILRIRSPEPAFAAPGDGRMLGLALHDLMASVEAEVTES